MAVALSLGFIALFILVYLAHRRVISKVEAESFKTREAFELAVQRFEKAVKEHGCPLSNIYERFKAVESGYAETAKTLQMHKISLERISKSGIIEGRKRELKREVKSEQGVYIPLNE